MADCGRLVFYTETELQDPELVVFEALKLSGAESVGSASRTLEPERGWAALQESLEGPFVAVKDADEGDAPTEDFFRSFTIREAAGLYRPDVCTRLIVGRNRVGLQVYQNIRDTIPPSICDPTSGFTPSGPSIAIGWHDIWENAENEEGHLFGRAFFSFGLFGYGTPHDWSAYRQLVFDVPAVCKLKNDLERIVGPLEQCVYWSV